MHTSPKISFGFRVNGLHVCSTKAISAGTNSMSSVAMCSSSSSTPLARAALTPGCQNGYMDHTSLSHKASGVGGRVVTPGCQIVYMDHLAVITIDCCFDCKVTW
jgi:hypothetical protein